MEEKFLVEKRKVTFQAFYLCNKKKNLKIIKLYTASEQ